MKKLIAFTFALLLMAGMASAIPTPQPISGIVDAYGDKSGYVIELEVLDSNVLPVTLITDSMGFYLWDFSGQLIRGDEILITVYYNREKLATKTVSFNGNPMEVPTFNLKEGIECPECPVCEICEECICEECEVCEPYICPDCPICPTGDWVWIVGIIGIVVGAGTGVYVTKNKIMGKHGTGIKVYTRNDGTIGTVHKHHGIRGYHDPDTLHRDPDEKHKKGELFPLFEKDATGKWFYVGG